MSADTIQVHPGEILREDVLPALGHSKTQIAQLLGVSRQTLYDILDERQSLTAEMAVRLGRLCGNGPDLWLSLQTAYDLEIARSRVDVSKIPDLSKGGTPNVEPA